MGIAGGCRIHKGRVIGWAKYPDSDTHLNLEAVTGDEELVWQGEANLYRPDLKNNGIGDGSYGFSFQIPSHLLDSNFILHLHEEASKKELPKSPIEIGDEFHQYRTRLLRMLAPPLWGIVSHSLKGHEMTIIGYLVAPEGELDSYGIYVDGKRAAEMSDQERNLTDVNSLKETFWFSSNNEKIGFKVTIDVDQCVKPNNLDQTPAVKVGIGKDEVEAENPLKLVYIPVLDEDQLVLPDDERRKRVQRNTSDVQFVTLGYSHYLYYRHLYELYTDHTWSEMTQMLDWGCGCGRVSQFFLRSHQAGKVVGVDIDKDNVNWCQDNLPGGRFESSELYPPLQFADDTFDFIVATSVFTHLDRETMQQWLAELSRILKPSGIAALTVNTDCTPAWRSFDEKTMDLIQEEGIYDSIVSPDLGRHLSEKDYYRNVFMSKDFINQNWNKYFNILNIEEHVFGYQDVVICQGVQ
jgi:ubiquinone/menaquinone biosynthesis C-methylase UbiE